MKKSQKNHDMYLAQNNGKILSAFQNLVIRNI